MSECLLDNEVFTCTRCGKEGRATDGTWLPVAIEADTFMRKLSVLPDEPPKIFAWDLRPPEVITSDDYIHYDCITEDDYKESNY